MCNIAIHQLASVALADTLGYWGTSVIRLPGQLWLSLTVIYYCLMPLGCLWLSGQLWLSLTVIYYSVTPLGRQLGIRTKDGLQRRHRSRLPTGVSSKLTVVANGTTDASRSSGCISPPVPRSSFPVILTEDLVQDSHHSQYVAGQLNKAEVAESSR